MKSPNKIKYNHIGLVKASGEYPFLDNYKEESTVIVQVKKDKDDLSPELWQYLGLRPTTKLKLMTVRYELLKAINEVFGTDFKSIRIQ
jgi:hypothetical protein